MILGQSMGGGGGGGGGGGNDMVTQEDTIFVSGMEPSTTEEEIAVHFGAIGVIKVSEYGGELFESSFTLEFFGPKWKILHSEDNSNFVCHQCVLFHDRNFSKLWRANKKILNL
jgi:hypothetical protein